MRGLRGRHEKKDRERERKKKCRWPASLQGVCCPANITSTPLTWTGPACCLNSFVVPRCIAAKQPICKLTTRCICTACGVVACLRLRRTPSCNCNAQHKHVDYRVQTLACCYRDFTLKCKLNGFVHEGGTSCETNAEHLS